ncbi:MAG: hypothetical protein KC483_09450 [Nitrosarchaeum sp.]|nr:hypothetical protein [Nitrosarchaeum sp.]
MKSTEEVIDSFNTASEKLQSLLVNAQRESLPISEIIELYYQIINVSSIAFMLKNKLGRSITEETLQKITSIELDITEKFNSSIHPQIIIQLSNTIQNTMKKLQSDSGNKTKAEIKNESQLYEELRQQMSTKEFVEQYDKNLQHA